MVSDLWLEDFHPFCVFLCFKVRYLMIVIMIDGSQKRNCEGGVWTLEFACFWKAQYYKARKDFKGLKTAFFCVLLLSFVLSGSTSVYLRRRGRFVNSAFQQEKFGPKIEVSLWQTNLKANVCRNSTFQVNWKKNATARRRVTSSNRAAIFVSTSCEERHNKPFWP